MNDPPISFEVCKTLLHADGARNDKLLVFDSLGDVCLQALWEAGIDPSIRDILNNRMRQ